jgi:hypothetical protein
MWTSTGAIMALLLMLRVQYAASLPSRQQHKHETLTFINGIAAPSKISNSSVGKRLTTPVLLWHLCHTRRLEKRALHQLRITLNKIDDAAMLRSARRPHIMDAPRR